MNWKEQIKKSVKNVENTNEDIATAVTLYPMQITPHYHSLIDHNNPNDPLLKIVSPSIQELNFSGHHDTMGEKEDYKIQGLQHRYTQTALLIINDYCASYCRFCFRKRLFNPDALEDESIRNIESALEYIKEHKEITNVLLSGGDPLMASSKKLKKVLDILLHIDHVQYVRIGTKIPAFLPQRILEDDALIDVFHEFNREKPLYIITHFDHPNEISNESKSAVTMLLHNGITVLSHIVLLKDVNDNEKTLTKLLNKLVESKIVPYYIFQAIPVIGATHFQVPLERGIDLFNSSMKSLSGMNKKIRFIIPHYIGKTEFIGKDDDFFYMRHHQARDINKVGKLFKVKKVNSKFWFNEKDIIYL